MRYWVPALFPFLLLQNVLTATTSECEKWFFESTKVEPRNPDCIGRCASAMVGMDTFMCPQQCKELCKIYLDRYIVDELTFRYSLSNAEKNLIAKYPKDALFVYLAKGEAEQSTKRLFKFGPHNNEGDAFRHFVWSGLVTNKIGEEKARLFLDAHEQDPNQPTSQKEMDSYNNDQGMAEANRLKKESSFSQENLEKGALKALREGKLKVLQLRGTIPDWR